MGKNVGYLRWLCHVIQYELCTVTSVPLPVSWYFECSVDFLHKDLCGRFILLLVYVTITVEISDPTRLLTSPKTHQLTRNNVNCDKLKMRERNLLKKLLECSIDLKEWGGVFDIPKTQ